MKEASTVLLPVVIVSTIPADCKFVDRFPKKTVGLPHDMFFSKTVYNIAVSSDLAVMLPFMFTTTRLLSNAGPSNLKKFLRH
jgi:hypothetical protein